MSERPNHDLEGLDLETARHIEEISRRFEADWRAGRQPLIEDYLEDLAGEARWGLQIELEALVQELRMSELAQPDRQGL